MKFPTIFSLSPLLILPSTVSAWGAAGHEITATIAQIHLQPSVLAYLQGKSNYSKALIPESSHGHLAPLSAWADRIKFFFHWSSELHYAGAVGDHPPDVCLFGENGWDGWREEEEEYRDVIGAIGNYTLRVKDETLEIGERDLALRWLVHYLGDLHQPLHLTSRERGGNGDQIVCNRAHINLHSLWDGRLIARELRSLSNYSKPLPSSQIEDSLRGTIYDSWIRFILWEGVRQWWRSSLPDWVSCPTASSTSSPNSNQLLFSTPSSSPSLLDELSSSEPSDREPAGTWPCPLHWARKVHEEVTCPLTFAYEEWNTTTTSSTSSSSISEEENLETTRRKHRNGDDDDDVPQLCTDHYLHLIDSQHVLPKLMALGGLRLAHVLNEIIEPLVDGDDDGDGDDTDRLKKKNNGAASTMGIGTEMNLNMKWLEEADRVMEGGAGGQSRVYGWPVGV